MRNTNPNTIEIYNVNLFVPTVLMVNTPPTYTAYPVKEVIISYNT